MQGGKNEDLKLAKIGGLSILVITVASTEVHNKMGINLFPVS
jgi:hypothetical protein